MTALLATGAANAADEPSDQPGYTVVATFIVKPGGADKLVQEMQSVAASNKSDPGVISYKVYKQAACGDAASRSAHKTAAGAACGGTTTFINVEKYVDETAFEKHMKQPYVLKALQELKPVLVSMQIHGLDPAI